MSEKHQQTFLKLKPPCVKLSSVALKFRTRDASVKDVLRALEEVRDVISDLGKKNLLNPHLAEYAFFPLAQQVFNETKKLSPRCLEVAIDCVTILVSYGYRRALSLKLGRELLILMLMLAGSGNNDSPKPPDELKVAAFKCMSEIIKNLASASGGSTLFEDQGTKNVVDPLVYLLLESIVDGQPENLQLAASEVLLQLIKAIKSRVFLASLLPRTVSSLTKALRPSTQVRRTKTVYAANLRVLRTIINRTLSDRVAVDVNDQGEKEALGESWLKATSTQIKNAFIQVAKLRNHESHVVHRALEELCVMIIEECRATLTDCVSVMIETLVMLSAKPDGASARTTCRHLVVAYPENAQLLRSSLANWSRSLPRIMQGHDEQPKVMALKRLTATSQILLDSESSSATITDGLVAALADGVSNALLNAKRGPVEIQSENALPLSVSGFSSNGTRHFDKFLLDHESQKDTAGELRGLIAILKSDPGAARATRSLVDNVIYAEGTLRLTSFWLALQLLEDSNNSFSINDFLVTDATEDGLSSRSSLLSDLHIATLPLLSSTADHASGDTPPWELQALAMECTVMYARTFEGDAYRPELMDTLYPILSFLGSSNTVLRSHAMTSLNQIAKLCQYSSTTEMMIDNVDYLVNSVAWKLNTYSLSPEAPQILRMMVHLCGAELIPYLDDLIQSIFAALDNYHGYPEWVETLFQTLRTMVDVSIDQPQSMITEGSSQPVHRKPTAIYSVSSDILDDLKSRKRRKIEAARPAEEPPAKAPHRPWTDRLDGPSFPNPEEAPHESDAGNEDNEHLSPMKPSEDEEKKLSKPHKLLLSIAQSTVPHLASPSPRVRHLLLGLLKDISPLLGRDENSFLPLINAVWPVVIPRLFAEATDDDSETNNEETAYNICAAADTVTMLCVNAGDFMSSRMDDIFLQLLRMFKRVRAQVNLSSQIGRNNVNDSEQYLMTEHEDPLRGSVNLQVIHQDTLSSAVTVGSESDAQLRSFQQPARTSKGRVLASLIDLLVGILSHVSLTFDRGDEIMQVLLPLITYKASIKAALDIYNADAVWLWDLRSKLQSKSDGSKMEKWDEAGSRTSQHER